MAPKGVKRPAAQGEGGVLKKPATFSEWAGEAAREEEAPESEVEGVDPRPITRQQRHVFERALAALPGTSEALPQAVREKHDELRRSRISGKQKQINAIVNAVVPRNATYSSRLDFTQPMALQKFETFFVEDTLEKQGMGVTWTEAVARLGGEGKGEDLLAKGQARGDITFKDGQYFFRRTFISHKQGHQRKETYSQQKADGSFSQQEFDERRQEMGATEWYDFCFKKASGGQLAIEDKKPCSEKAWKHLEDGYNAMVTCIKRVREKALQVRQIPDSKRSATLNDVLAKAVKEATSLEADHATKIFGMRMKENSSICDSEIKTVLNASTASFKLLVQHDKELAVLIRAAGADK